jgi:hypothetical protein
MNTYRKWAIITWVITVAAAFATIKAESRTLIFAVIALAIFGYILWIWEEIPNVQETKPVEQEKK